ncbi:P-loop containing nucleoside triphosphate hydrolase protein [Kockovaella imperatae]|uniref:p-loop containing nucleoside triphosphate hydrolase protein n=1 Tax=Kockovaella imperatae TaxID=4999 RepID=A0A1Y1ULH4_9TREE|nr:P-loop containing nucleoside triphosphate hydrolase protein [Kockovaella imperatae]ORX38364.1 P-loop containing nucleoside triphosphate hydrolase protein [Kockovaella imperatae]
MSHSGARQDSTDLADNPAGTPSGTQLSPTPTVYPPASNSYMTSIPPATSDSASTEVDDPVGEKRDYLDEKIDFKGKGLRYKDDRFEDRGILEVEDEKNQKKKVRVVMEQKSGRELIAEVEENGNYTVPRWRHSLPFVNPKFPPPPAPLSLDDPAVTPEASASFFSLWFFNWISPMMALGSARTLQATDLWKMDDARSAAVLSEKFVGHLQDRQVRAAEYNRLLADPKTPLPLRQRIYFSLLPNRKEREHEYRTKTGKRTASIGWALSDTFGAYFWAGGLLKMMADLSQSTTPLTLRAIINWSTKYDHKRKHGGPGPGIGLGIGLAFVILAQLLISSWGIHHFFVRGMSTGVQLRSAIISAVYRRSLRLTQKSRGEIPNGKIINHISTDTSRIDFAAGFFHMAWTAPVQFVVISVILLIEIGYAALPGIGFLLIGLPLQTYAMKSLFSLRKASMMWTDKRAKLLQEILGGMRIVKFMAWEVPFLDRLGKIRGMELRYVRRLLRFRSGLMAFAMSLPVLAAILSFITYSLTAHNLQAATVFSVITLFQLMRMPLMIWPMSLSACADALTALKRLEVVFDAEVLTEERVINPNQADAVKITHASFQWDAAPFVDDGLLKKLEGKVGKDGKSRKASIADMKAGGKKSKSKKLFRFNKKTKKVTLAEEAHTEMVGDQPNLAEAGAGGLVPTATDALDEASGSTPSDSIFEVRDIDLSIPRGSLTAIVGPIGSGKSSLLQGLMGEMRRTEGKVSFSGRTSLCSQTPWIQNATVRENILFGQEWDEERYWAAVRDSCLEPDLELLEDGDGTEIGEKGINLSGGQKQRVNIARAIYFNADIIALDDPLSALDAGVGKALFFNAIVGALSGKTRILVTHALHFLPYVDNIVVMNDGRISEQGTYNELKAAGGAFSRLIRDFGADDEHEAQDEKEEDAIERSMPAIKHDRSKMIAQGTVKSLMQDEERNSGALKRGTYGNYFKAGRGHYMVPLLIGAVVLYQCFFVITSYWLVWWQEHKWHQPNAFYMAIYAGLGIGSAFAMFLQGYTNAAINYFASVTLYRNAIQRVMFAPQSFFDTTPLGRIMNRFSKDVDTIDNTLSDAMRMTVSTLGSIIGATILVAIINPYFLLAVAFVLTLYAHNAQFYRRSAREFKRIDSILRSSLYSHFSESLSGIATIRSYGESERFCEDNIKRMDIENRAYYLTIINQRWLGIRLDMLGSLLTFTVAIIICTADISPAKGGLALSTMITVQQSFSWLVRQIAEVENDMVGAERIMHYANELEQEAPHEIKETKVATSWPSQGAIEFDNVKMRYREELPEVLKGLTISVKANEKIGVVGRTGAGKSSIMVSLFRMCELSSGRITIDGVDISEIGLNDLRSGMSIIPQDPLLFSGTLRSNIDPFNTKSDIELYDALRRAHLVHSETARPSIQLPSGAVTPTAQGSQTPGQRRFTLDMAIEEEGGNLSVGERSLVSLARALVRGTKILVLDEATASVDVETDAKIQSTIREQFGDRTLLCIAHRLRTILSYDRILVMSDGQVEEFDTPFNLFLANGFFTEMCHKSAITIEDIKAAAQLRF